jgi:hypothetical protein
MSGRRFNRFIGDLARIIDSGSQRSRPRRSKLTHLFLSACFISFILGASIPTVYAQDKSAPDFYLPEIAKKFPPGRARKCKECTQQQAELNLAWNKLIKWDKQLAGRNFRQYWSEFETSEKALKALAAGGDTAALEAAWEAASKKAGNALQKFKDKYKNPATGQQNAEEMAALVGTIIRLAKELEDCEKKCKPPDVAVTPQPPATTPQPPPTPPGGTNITFKPIPDCFNQAYIDDLQAQWEKINFPLTGESGLKAKLINMGDEKGPEYEKLKAAIDQAEAKKKAIEEQKKKAYEKWKMPCPDGSGMYFRGSSKDDQTYAVTFVDTGEDCTFGRSEPISTPLTPTDVNFNPIPDDVGPQGSTPTDIPETPRTAAPQSSPTAEKPPVSDTPKTPTDTPKTPTDRPRTPTASETPPDQPQAPDQPTTTEKPPETPTTTTDAPPTDDVVILFKGNQAVLERNQAGDPLQRQHIMLVFRKPELRESGTGKPAIDDSGFDKDGVHGVTGADGQAKLTVPAEDRELYLSSFDGTPKKYYRVDANVMKNTGGVREIARNAKPDLTSGAPQGGKVNAEIFKIGDRTFVRRLYVAPFGVTVVLITGDEIDWCRVVLPGPALGMEPEYPSALHRELPETTIKLPRAGRRGRHSR